VVAKLVEQGIALIQFVVIGGIFGVVIGYSGSRTDFKGIPLWGAIWRLSSRANTLLGSVRMTAMENYRSWKRVNRTRMGQPEFTRSVSTCSLDKK
jgi:hypothetical protein